VDTKRFLTLVNYWKEKRNKNKNWEAGIRTPIGGSRERLDGAREEEKGTDANDLGVAVED